MNDQSPSDEHRRRSSFGGLFFKKLKFKNFILSFLCLAMLLCSAFFLTEPGKAKSPTYPSIGLAAPSGMFFVGERLEYEVSYSIFSLGTVKIEVVDSAQENGVTIFHAKAFMDSYGGVPFVNLHWIFFSEIDPQLYSHYFSGVDNKDTNHVSYSNYSFDYPHKRIILEEGIRQQQDSVTKTSDTISSNYQDGLSLFFYARGNVHSNSSENVPTFVSGKKVNTYIDFLNKKTSSEIDAIKYPVETIELEGRADFVGIFGLTGGFSGWFSNDEAAVPIIARMKVIIGSVRLELIKWNRPGWVPPRAPQD
ncbi:MAG: DUF3108 domain-containing protein [Bacteroidota bacterium]